MQRPNIILMNCDDLGYGDVGCYGSELNRTPAIDWLSQNGATFTDFHSASPVCSPSRAALQTGCYPKRIDFDTFDGFKVLFPGHPKGINRSEYTMPQLMKDAGYATMIVGKWHCGDQEEFLPLNYGFDHHYGLPYSNDMGRQEGRLVGATPAGWKYPFPPLPLLKDNEVIQQQPDLASLTERYVEHATGFVRESVRKQTPFFLYFAHMQVHLPLYAPARFEKNSQNGRFGACVECVDWSVSVLLEQLKELGQLENTIFIFTSDNGSTATYGASNGPLRGDKSTNWEGGHRVPFIFFWKKLIDKPFTCDAISSNMDLLPTFAEILDMPLSKNKIDGQSLLGVLKGDEQAAESMRERTLFHYFNSRLEAVRSGKWKLHLIRTNKAGKVSEKVNELYDLRADIGEQNNVFDFHPDVVEKLTALAAQLRGEIGDAYEDVAGKEVRPAGRAKNPKPLTVHREDYPYIDAIYDRDDAG